MIINNILNTINTISINSIQSTFTPTPKRKKVYIIKNVKRIKCKQKNVGRPIEYHNRIEYAELRKEQKRDWYNKTQAQHRKDTDKSYISIPPPKELNRILSKFYSDNYRFSHVITLTTGQKLDKGDRTKVHSQADYIDMLSLTKYHKEKRINSDTLYNMVQSYLKTMENIIEYYFVSFELTTDGLYHAHIAFQVKQDNPIKNLYSYMPLRWGYQSKLQKIKYYNESNHLKHKETVLSYIGKDIHNNTSDIISWESNIDKSIQKLKQVA